jgi:hypothetical protein
MPRSALVRRKLDVVVFFFGILQVRIRRFELLTSESGMKGDQELCLAAGMDIYRSL